MKRLAARVHDVRRSGDEGQLILLVLAYAVIAALLVTVVVNVSKVYLNRRSLVAAADGAALSAANQPDLAAVYNGAAGATLPLSTAGTEAAVRQYARDADLADRFEGFQVVDVTTDGVTVTVTLRAEVGMPFLNLLSDQYSAGYPVRAVARARSPLSP